MKMKAGMPVWAKEDYIVDEIKEVSTGIKYTIVSTLGSMFQVENNQGLRTTFEREKFNDFFNTIPPKKQTEGMGQLNERDLKVLKYYKEGNSLSGFEGVHSNLCDLDYLDGDLELTQKGRDFIKVHDFESPIIKTQTSVFKSLEEIQKELAKEQEFDYFLQLVAIAENTYATMQIINDVSSRYATQYREAYESEKAESQRLISEIEKLKNRILDNVKKAIEDARISSYDPTKGIEFIYSYEDIVQSLEIDKTN